MTGVKAGPFVDADVDPVTADVELVAASRFSLVITGADILCRRDSRNGDKFFCPRKPCVRTHDWLGGVSQGNGNTRLVERR